MQSDPVEASYPIRSFLCWPGLPLYSFQPMKMTIPLFSTQDIAIALLVGASIYLHAPWWVGSWTCHPTSLVISLVGNSVCTTQKEATGVGLGRNRWRSGDVKTPHTGRRADVWAERSRWEQGATMPWKAVPAGTLRAIEDGARGKASTAEKERKKKKERDKTRARDCETSGKADCWDRT